MIGFDINQTELSNFEVKAKEIIESYYLVPYPENPIPNHWQKCPSKENLRDGKIARFYHGAMHVSRAALYIDHLHHLYGKYDQALPNKLSALASSLSTDQNTLLALAKYATLFHDSGRQDEDVDYWDNQSAENLRRYLRENHVPEHLIQLFGAAAQFKGEPAKFRQAVNAINLKFHLNINPEYADYARQLISNADTLDVMRVRTAFDMKYLDIYQQLGHIPKAKNDIVNMCKMAGNVIYKQSDGFAKSDIYEHGNYHCNAIPKHCLSTPAKLVYEQAQNPYIAIRQDLIEEGFVINKQVEQTSDNYNEELLNVIKNKNEVVSPLFNHSVENNSKEEKHISRNMVKYAYQYAESNSLTIKNTNDGALRLKNIIMDILKSQQFTVKEQDIMLRFHGVDGYDISMKPMFHQAFSNLITPAQGIRLGKRQ